MCKHNIEFKETERDYVTYCKECGEILSVKPISAPQPISYPIYYPWYYPWDTTPVYPYYGGTITLGEGVDWSGVDWSTSSDTTSWATLSFNGGGFTLTPGTPEPKGKIGDK